MKALCLILALQGAPEPESVAPHPRIETVAPQRTLISLADSPTGPRVSKMPHESCWEPLRKDSGLNSAEFCRSTPCGSYMVAEGRAASAMTLGWRFPRFADPHRVAQRPVEHCATRKGSELIFASYPGSRRPWATMSDPRGGEQQEQRPKRFFGYACRLGLFLELNFGINLAPVEPARQVDSVLSIQLGRVAFDTTTKKEPRDGRPGVFPRG
ncbi:MAG: hypothetical protein RL095_1967 [Verrucomicrobiota bacterium]|jgi:hypothetical protein